jgi:hypothetical protein
MNANEIINKLRDIAYRLEPEWLTCDGELPRAEVNRRYRALMAEKNKLELKLGRPLTNKELYETN